MPKAGPERGLKVARDRADLRACTSGQLAVSPHGRGGGGYECRIRLHHVEVLFTAARATFFRTGPRLSSGKARAMRPCNSRVVATHWRHARALSTASRLRTAMHNSRRQRCFVLVCMLLAACASSGREASRPPRDCAGEGAPRASAGHRHGRGLRWRIRRPAPHSFALRGFVGVC